jgi:hypothetical protein
LINFSVTSFTSLHVTDTSKYFMHIYYIYTGCIKKNATSEFPKKHFAILKHKRFQAPGN